MLQRLTACAKLLIDEPRKRIRENDGTLALVRNGLVVELSIRESYPMANGSNREKGVARADYSTEREDSASISSPAPLAPLEGQEETLGIGASVSTNDIAVVEQALRWPLARWAELCRQLDAQPERRDEIWKAWGLPNVHLHSWISSRWTKRIAADPASRAEFERLTGRAFRRASTASASAGAPLATAEPTMVLDGTDRVAKAGGAGPNFTAKLAGQGPGPLPLTPNQEATIALGNEQSAAPSAGLPAANTPAVPPPAPVGPAVSDVQKVLELTDWPLEKWALLRAQIEIAPAQEQQVWSDRQLPDQKLQQRVTNAWTKRLEGDAELKKKFTKHFKRHLARLRRSRRA